VIPTSQRNVLPPSSGQTFGTVCLSKTSVIKHQPSRCHKSDYGSVILHHRENINLRSDKGNLNAALCRNMDPIIIWAKVRLNLSAPLIRQTCTSRTERTQFVQWIDKVYLHIRFSIFGTNGDTTSCCHIRTRLKLTYPPVLWSVGALPSSAQSIKISYHHIYCRGRYTS
jgi:hypothetical protein